MAMTATVTVRRYFWPRTPAICIISGSAESEITYGTTLVTTARFTSTANCSLSDGDMVDSAISDWTIAITIIPTMGASIRLTLANQAGNTHGVSAMLEPIPCTRLSPFGFHATANVSGLNQNQPKIESRPTGRITPQTVTDPMRPVTVGPPKFAIVVSQISAMTPMQVATAVDDSHGKNAAREPTAEI